jgi:thiamine pyrophosphate-dependent acetolactate synthase large subunit-like protein
MRGSTAIARILKLEGVEQVFCFPYTPILEALAEEGIRPIVARQERVAENMADGLSRASNGRKLGVVTVQASAGAENAFAGIAHACTDSSPLLFLPGHPGRAFAGVPPTFDAVKHYAAATRWADVLPSADCIADRMRRAFTLLRSGRPGPVLLELPADVAREEMTRPLDYRPVPHVRFGPDPDAVRDAVGLLLAAERPMIWAGQGVLYAEASTDLVEVAELLAAPVMTTLLGKSAFPETHSLALGTGSHSRTSMVTDYLNLCDAIFAIGASLTRTVFAPELPPGKRIVHATLDRRDLNKDYAADVPLLGDAKLTLRQMAEEIRRQAGESGRPGRAAVEAHVAGVKKRWCERWVPKLRSDEVPLNPYRVLGELMKSLDPVRSIVTHDSGNPRDQFVPLYEAVTPRGYLGWGHSTQLGFSLGLAMGAKLAFPEKTVVNVMGDAAFGMVGMDIETAVRERIPILTVLLNNSAMGNYERMIPKATERFRTKYLSGDYSTVARGLGAHAEQVEQPRDIGPALQRALSATREANVALVEFITREEPDMAIAGMDSH